MPAMPAQKPVTLFFCYAPEDEELRRKLDDHLALLVRGGVVESWSGGAVGAGAEWRSALDRQMERADVILLLVSAAFLASDHLYDVELRRALGRREAGRSEVLGVLLRPCDWNHEELASVRMLPERINAAGAREVVPVTSLPNLDDAFARVVTELRTLLEKERAPAPRRISRNPPLAHSLPAPRG